MVAAPCNVPRYPIDMNAAPEILADAYLRFYERNEKSDAWAYDEVHRLVDQEPQVGWVIICLLVEKARSDEVLAYVAAGPLEEILRRHGPAIISLAEEECHKNSRFPLALSGVWGIDPGDPIFNRWYELMWKYGYAEGRRNPL